MHTTFRPVSSKRHLHVLSLNSGSSSLKFGLYDIGPSSIERLLSGAVDAIDKAQSTFYAIDAGGRSVTRQQIGRVGGNIAIEHVARLLTDLKTPHPDVIGHRIVHGGPKLRQHCVLSARALKLLKAAVPFAPLHLPAELSLIQIAKAHFPNLLQVVCFDTSFLLHMPDVARVLPLPRNLRAEGVQRYGFHGLSCESIVRQLGSALPSRLVIAHLGNGASITAVKNGISIDTSMGLTPTGGILMGTRTGDLDPGVLVYLARQKRLNASRLEDLVDHRSGLLGISGVAADLRMLHKAARSDADARLGIDMFCYSAAKGIAAMSVALGRVESIVFTAGIGENDAEVRREICRRLAFMGVHLDRKLNRQAAARITDSASTCPVLVLPCQEDDQIAMHSRALYLQHRSAHRAGNGV